MNDTLRKFLIVGCMAVSAAAFAAEIVRKEAVIVMDYAGNRRHEIAPLADRVRLQVRQAPTQIASRLGLIQFKEGFQYPLTIRFVDKVRLADEEFEPRDLERAPALLRFVPDREGTYRQDLVLNPNVYFERPLEFDRVLDRQLSFIVLNEAMGPDSLDLPNWVRQGLATYAAGTGEELLQKAALQEREEALAEQRSSPQQPPAARKNRYLQELDAAFSWRSQVQYYLAVRYIQKQGGIDGLQNFVRNIISGKSVDESLEQAISMDLDAFKRNVRIYSTQVFNELART